MYKNEKKIVNDVSRKVYRFFRYIDFCLDIIRYNIVQIYKNIEDYILSPSKCLWSPFILGNYYYIYLVLQ